MSPQEFSPALTLAEAEARLCAPGGRFEMETVMVDGRPLSCWKQQHHTLADLARFASSHYAERDFIVYEDERLTYRHWFNAVARLADHLVRAGLSKGDRVALAMRNYPEWPVVFFAAAAAGAIVVPLNAWWTGAELRHGLAQSGSRMLFCDTERWDRIQSELAGLPQLESAFVCRRAHPAEGATRLEDVIGTVADYQRLPDANLPSVRIKPDDDATILYTSGTTGLPKGALATHRSNLIYILGTAYAWERAALRRGEAAARQATHILLSAVPLFHVTGLNACLFPLMDVGGTFVMMHKWDATRALQLIERERVTRIGGVPTIVWELIEHPDREAYDISSLGTVFYGGALSAPELVRKIRSDLKATPANGWGMTEVCAAGTYNNAEDYLLRPDSCGPAFCGTELRIMGQDAATEMPPGEVGELWIRGAQLIKGYWNNPEATAAAIRDGWLRTGDLARIDADGFCYIVGRAKDMIIRGGENIYPVEIENILYQHPAVIDVAVVGIAHRTLGEQPAAVVHLAPGSAAGEDELKSWVSARIASFKVPVRIEFLENLLPRNANGKIMKNQVRDLLEDR